MLQGQNVTFAGTGSGTHNFTVSQQLVNSEVVDTTITLDGVTQRMGFVLNVVNNSSSPDDQVFLTLLGKNQDLTAWYYLARAGDADMTEFDDQPGAFLSQDTTSGAFIGGERYSIALSDLTPVGPKVRQLIVPRDNVVSGRIFFSFGRKLRGIGINCPYYNTFGNPITQPAQATGALIAGNGTVSLSGIDATRVLAVNEPVSYTINGTTVQATLQAVESPLQVVLTPAPTVSANPVTLNFQPDAGVLAAAKLSLSEPSLTGSPDYLTTFELMELSATTDPNAADPFYTLFANTTAIDFFSIGLGMTVNFSGLPQGPPPVQATVGFGSSAADIQNGVSQRDAIFARLNNSDGATPSTPPEFQNFVTAQPAPSPLPGIDPHITLGQPVPTSLDIIRVLGPPQVTALQPQGPLANFLESTISTQWGPFCSTAQNLSLVFPLVSPAFTFTGSPSVSSTTLNLQCTQAAGSNTGLNEQYRMPQPTTRIVFECDDTQNPGPYPNNYTNLGTDAHKRLSSILCAAFARGVFPLVADWGDRTKFYSRTDRKYNFFSRVMHEFALNGIVYGFAYDDVYGQDSTLAGPLGLTRDGKLPSSDRGNVVDVTLTIPAVTPPPNTTPAAPPPPPPSSAPLLVEAVLTCGPNRNLNPEGCLVHFTSTDGKTDVNAPLDHQGTAIVTGVNPNQPYILWISPAGPLASQWYFSYAVNGQYDGTNGRWSSSYGTNTPGVIRLQMGQLVPGVGSCMNPAPQVPRDGGLPPLPTAKSGQSDWGN